MKKKESTEKKQLLRDPDIHPTNNVLSELLGDGYEGYTAFLEMLANLEIKLEWRYYFDGKAWLGKGLYQWKTKRGSEKEKTVFWLSAWEGFFRVGFFFSEKARAGLQDLSIGESVKKKIECVQQMGKLKFSPLIFDIASAKLPADLEILIRLQLGINKEN